jgi:hypothetical protein
MGQFRLSMAGMLWFVAVTAIGLASIRSTSGVWTTVAATLTLAALLKAVLAAALLRGNDRAFWLGFAVFGWVYLILVDWDWVGGPFGHELTGALADWAEAVIPEAPRPSPAITNLSELHQERMIKIGHFVQIGRMVLCLLFAMAGGVIGRKLAADRERGA